MATFTVLQMVQNILSAMSSDEVNDIADTPESEQVAQILQNKYYDIVARGDLTLDSSLFQLNPSNNNTLPVSMAMPAGVTRIDWLQYFDTNPTDNTQTSQFGAFSHNLNLDLVSPTNWITTSSTSNSIGLGQKTFTVASNTLSILVGQGAQVSSGANTMFGTVVSYIGFTLVINVIKTGGSGTFTSWVLTNSNSPSVPGYRYVNIVPVDYFLDITNRFDITQNNVFTYTFTAPNNSTSYTFKYLNDRQPSFCTVISNQSVIFDSFDSSQDNTLQASKTMAWGAMVPPFQLTNNFVPLLDDFQFSLLLNEAKSLAFYELKQMPHAKADEEIKRQWAVTQKTKSKSNKPGYFDQLSNFGRVPRTGGYGGYPLWRFMRNSMGNSGVN